MNIINFEASVFTETRVSSKLTFFKVETGGMTSINAIEILKRY